MADTEPIKAILVGDGKDSPLEIPCIANPRRIATPPEHPDYLIGVLNDGDGVKGVCDNCPLEDATGLDANGDGCIDRTPALPAVVEDLCLPQGIENALLASVENAQRALARGAVNAARGQLNALINKLKAQQGKKISVADADMLMAFVENVLAQLP